MLTGSEVIDYIISKVPDEERMEKVEFLGSISGEKVVVGDNIIETSELQKMVEKWAKNHLDVKIMEITVEELKALTDLRQGKLPTPPVLLSAWLKNLNTTGADG